MITEVQMHPLAWQYLEQLRSAALELPRARRNELIADIETHLTEATSPTMSNAEVLNEIDKLGDPDEIVAAAADPRDPATATNPVRTFRDWATVVLLMFGILLAGVGWIVGVVMLWSSKTWSKADKLIGTFLFPSGIAIGAIAIIQALVPKSKWQTISLSGSGVSELANQHMGTLTASGPFGAADKISANGNTITIHTTGFSTAHYSSGTLVALITGAVILIVSIYSSVRLARRINSRAR